MKRYSIIFKRTKNKIEQTYLTCSHEEITKILEFMEIYEENILSIMEIN